MATKETRRRPIRSIHILYLYSNSIIIFSKVISVDQRVIGIVRLGLFVRSLGRVAAALLDITTSDLATLW
jgi:hypothetical protein